MRISNWLKSFINRQQLKRRRSDRSTLASQHRSTRLGRTSRQYSDVAQIDRLEDRVLLATFQVLNTNDSGEGSLRAAVSQANAAAGTDSITFDQSLSNSTIVLTSGELLVTDAVTVTGPGSSLLAISGNHASRVLNINKIQAIVSISGLTIRNGNVSEGAGGILSDADLMLVDVIVTGNSTTNQVNGGVGGILSRGPLTLTNSVVSNNTSQGDSGVGGLSIEHSATISNSTITGNVAGRNAAISNRGTLTIINSTISNNTATDAISAINNNEQGILTITGTTISGNTSISRTIYNQGTLTISESTISENTTTNGEGAGVYNGGYIRDSKGTPTGNRPGTATISNSTISGNTANRDGGGIWNSTTGSLTITNSSIVGNTSQSGNNGSSATSGGIFTNTPITISNSIIANSTGGEIGGPGNVSGGNNRFDKAHATSIGAVTNLDLELRPMGGPTLVHRLLAGSNAINTGDNNVVSGSTDQRRVGFDRIVAGTVDIGAFESGNAIPQLIQIEDASVVEGNSETRELVFKVFLSNDASAVDLTFQTEDISTTTGNDYTTISNGMVTLAAGSGNYHSIIVFVNGDLDVEANETLRLRLLSAGESATPAFYNTVGIGTIVHDDLLKIVVDSKSDVVDGADGVTTLREAVTTGNNSAITTEITFASALNGSTILLSGTEITATIGVIVLGPGSGSLTISGNSQSRIFDLTAPSTISGVTLTKGNLGNGQSGGAIQTTADLTVSDSVFSANTAMKNGGAIDSSGGVLTISNSIFKNNTTSEQGGAIAARGSKLVVSGSTITGSVAVLGAVFAGSATTVTTITDTTISGNSGGGGGVFAGPATVTSSAIFGNTSNPGFLAFGGVLAASTLNISNSTISGKGPSQNRLPKCYW